MKELTQSKHWSLNCDDFEVNQNRTLQDNFAQSDQMKQKAAKYTIR